MPHNILGFKFKLVHLKYSTSSLKIRIIAHSCSFYDLHRILFFKEIEEYFKCALRRHFYVFCIYFYPTFKNIDNYYGVFTKVWLMAIFAGLIPLTAIVTEQFLACFCGFICPTDLSAILTLMSYRYMKLSVPVVMIIIITSIGVLCTHQSLIEEVLYSTLFSSVVFHILLLAVAILMTFYLFKSWCLACGVIWIWARLNKYLLRFPLSCVYVWYSHFITWLYKL